MSTPDTDGDGLSDVDESVFGLDLNNPDEDSDGMEDGREKTIGVFLNPISNSPSREEASRFNFALNQSKYYSQDWQPGNGQNGRATGAGFIPEDYFLLDNQVQAETSVLAIGNISRLNSDVYSSEWAKGYYSVNTFDISQSPGSFILPYDANNTPQDRADDFLVPGMTTESSLSLTPATADTGLSDSQNLTTPSKSYYLDPKTTSTDVTLTMGGLTLSRRLNSYWTLSITFSDYQMDLSGNFLLGMDPALLAGTGIYDNGQTTAGSYGELLKGTATDPNLGSVQMGYGKIFGSAEIVTPVSASTSVQIFELQYRPNGDDTDVYRMILRPALNMNFAAGSMTLSLSDQFRKFYYDTAQFGEFSTSVFGASYLSNGGQTLRAPKFFNALLDTIDYPATQGDTLARKAMEWFFNGANSDDSPTLIRDANGYVTNMHLASDYQATMSLGLSAQNIGTHQVGSTRDLQKDASTLTVGISLSNGNSPFFDWLMGVSSGGSFSIHMTDENLLKNLFPFVQYDLLYDSHMANQGTETAGAWNNITELSSEIAGLTQLNNQSVADLLSGFNIASSVSDPYLTNISDAYSLIAGSGFNGPNLNDILKGATTFNFSDYFTQADLTALLNKLEEFYGIQINASDQQFLMNEFIMAFPVQAGNDISVELDGPAGSSLQNVTMISVDELPADGKPDVDFPYGLVDLTVTNLTPGDTVNIKMVFPGTVPTDCKYYKYSVNHGWREYGNVTGLGDGDNKIMLILTDGGEGDDDGIANGVIVDPSGPGVSVTSATTTPPATTGGGGGGGCVIRKSNVLQDDIDFSIFLILLIPVLLRSYIVLRRV